MKQALSIHSCDMLNRYIFLVCSILLFSFWPSISRGAFTNETATLFPSLGVVVPGYWVCWGDYNNDGYIDILDIIVTVNIVLGQEPFNYAADINQDGIIIVWM